MRAVACLLGLALAAGPARAAVPPARPQGDGAARAQVEAPPALDALIAGGLARGCDALDAGSRPEPALAEQLLARPEALHRALVRVLEDGSWRVPGDGERRLRVGHRDWIRALAAGLPRAAVLEAARSDLEGGAPAARLRARLLLAGEVARARDVRLLGALAAAAGPRAAAADYGAALASTLRREAETCRELDAAWDEVDPALRLAALDALAGCGRPQAVAVLAARLDDQPELRAAVLARLGALAEGLEEPADLRAAAQVRALLDDPRAAVRREAALCAGRLQDADSAPRLLELLESGQRGERDAALWALRRVSTLGFSADPRPWRLWLEDERRWWEERAATCLAGLSDPRPEVVLAALDELSRRRLDRDALAAAVVSMGGPGGELAERRCHVLRALASRAGLGFLRECLAGSRDEAVLRAAEGAWRASTALPPPGSAPTPGPR